MLIGLGVFAAANVVVTLAAAVTWVIPAVVAGTPVEQVTTTDVPPLAMVVAAGISSVLAFVGVPWWVSRTKGTQSMAADLGLRWVPGDLALGLGLGTVALGCGMVGGLVYRWVAPGDTLDNTGLLTQSATSWPTAILVVVVVAGVIPFAEEVFFRGLVLRTTLARYSTPLAVAVSAVLFGAMHAFGASGPALVLIPAVTASYGAVFALGVVLTNRLGASIIAHAMVNAAVALTVLSAL